jgi:hypothetical protein
MGLSFVSFVGPEHQDKMEILKWENEREYNGTVRTPAVRERTGGKLEPLKEERCFLVTELLQWSFDDRGGETASRFIDL